MTYKRRIYYFPGIISLLGLSLFLLYNKDEFKIKKYTTIDLNMPSEEKDIRYSPYNDVRFTSHYIRKQFRNKKQIGLTLDSNQITNEKKIDLIRLEAQRLKYTHDTNTVIRVDFTDEITYRELVRLLDICEEDDQRHFALMDNTFVIFGEPLPQKRLYDDSPCMLWNDVIVLKNERVPGMKEKFLLKIKPYTGTKELVVLTGWIILTATSIYYYRKRKLLISPPSSSP